MKNKTVSRAKRLAAVISAVLMTLTMILPLAAYGENTGKTVRVGWFESPFNSIDNAGRRSGYAYEYQIKIAAYTGWNYTYVTGSWPDLLQMLADGEIDLMSDVSYTDERAEKMLFPELSMGSEEYCIFISPDNKDITSDDFSSLNGKRIGVNQGSVQVGFYRAWAERHNVNAELSELTLTETDSLKMLADGELDAYITLNGYGDPESVIPVCRIGSSDFYFAVNKNRGDLLDELNSAMSRIHDENSYYNQRLYEKYVRRSGTNAFLSADEEAWLGSHGAIRVGYQDNYLAFCTSDPSTGELTGALKDYLEYASDCMADAKLEFKATAYPTAAAALEALKNGEIDCVFPANLSSYYGETYGVLITPALMRTDVYAIVRQEDKTIFGKKEHVVVAVNEGNPNYDSFLTDNYPGWHKVYYKGISECLKSVSDGVADCVLISNFRFNNVSRMCEQYGLTNYSTGKGLDYCFAVSKKQTGLYSILAKVVGIVPNSTVNSSLSYYITEDAKRTFGDFVEDYFGYIILIIAAVMALFLILFIRSARSERKARSLISATETDSLTGLYNRDYFFEYANRIYNDNPDVPRDAIVLNIEQFHSINALSGWEFGDRILRFLGNEIQ
ncbi:MAG: transporter substrate-binding domain-containing protein, partial [Clostridia bacterium]|nr:transporter substrate-binding domain-containing protein [Clostridia bacterium]